MAPRETPTQMLVNRILLEKTGKDLKTFLAERRTSTDPAEWGWEDIAFDLRTITGVRPLVRDTVHSWARRYEIPERVHDYGVSVDADPEPVETT
jgi:hypothetical protein